MQPVVFSAAWFGSHQRTLLRLLAWPVVGRWFRWVLCIRRHDVGYHGRIVQLLPHAYTVAHDDGTLTTDFRTHAKYAKRLYHAFRPAWWTLHVWDARVANPFVPALNAGFDTLTAYPDPDPETATVDGNVRRDGVDEAWGTIRAGAGTAADDAFNNRVIGFNASATLNQWTTLYRAFYLFDTSAIGAAGAVTATTFSVYGTVAIDNLGVSPTIDVYTTTPATNTALVAADFSQIGTTSQTGSPIAVGAWSTSGYNTWTLNATGIASIATTGVTKFGTRNANYDVANTAPTWTASQGVDVQGYTADQTGTANDPKLVVTYNIPTFRLITLLGTAPV